LDKSAVSRFVRELLGNIVETRFTIVIAAEDGD
jgi:hypothetical protein